MVAAAAVARVLLWSEVRSSLRRWLCGDGVGCCQLSLSLVNGQAPRPVVVVAAAVAAAGVVVACRREELLRGSGQKRPIKDPTSADRGGCSFDRVSNMRRSRLR